MVGISACDFAGFLQVIVDAVDKIVNECEECDDPNAPKSSFGVLESKLTSLLQDGVGGTPSVDFVSVSDDIRSTLDIDITLAWR